MCSSSRTCMFMLGTGVSRLRLAWTTGHAVVTVRGFLGRMPLFRYCQPGGLGLKDMVGFINDAL
jgi:hypothetical protein